MDYNESSIVSLSGLEHIRHRSTGYIPDTGIQGIFHISKEIIDNSIDELALAKDGGVLNVLLFIDKGKSNFKLVVTDNGRGIPHQKLIDVFSNTQTSGKFSDVSYNGISTGSFGIGASVTLALANWFRAITLNRNVIADATIRYDNIPEQPEISPNDLNRTGTIVMFEPDTTIFRGITDYTNDYSKLTEYLIQMSLYNNFQIRLFVLDEMPKSAIKYSTKELIDYIDKFCNGKPDFDSRNLDKERYVTNFFGIARKWTKIIDIKAHNDNYTLLVDMSIRVLLQGGAASNSRLTFVNNILFTDAASLHISLLDRKLKSEIAKLITDSDVKDFVIKHYRLPIWLVADIKFKNAVFTGLEKYSFRDVSFIDPYQYLLNDIITDHVILSLYDVIKDHITTAYNKFSNNEFKVGSMKQLISKLNRPDKFNNCSTTDRQSAELFLVEGDSAKSDQDRDSRFQASYTLGGKPLNSLDTIEKLKASRDKLKKNAIFQDIIMIMNITPGSDDMSNLNFGKIIIMADADTHGYHITNIVIGNLMALCPALITSGRVYVTIPPLYRLSIKGSQSIYVRNTTELNATLAYHLYYRCIDIALVSDTYHDYLGREEYVVFSDLILTIGDEIERLSREYMIPPYLLEKLSLLTPYLNVDNPNLEMLRQHLGIITRYDNQSKILIISIGKEDIIIPLIQITDLIYDRLLPLYKKFYYGKTSIRITTKNSNLYRDTEVTIYHLFELFKQLNGMFKISRFKGLGKMNDVDRYRTCTNPETRRIFQITSLGSIEEIFQMMGRDATYRKQLIL